MTEARLRSLRSISALEHTNGEAAEATGSTRNRFAEPGEVRPKIALLQEKLRTGNRHRLEDFGSLDQDDAYGSHRPKFATKNNRVTGGTDEVVKLQRLAALDQERAFLGPLQPDLTGERVSQKRIFETAGKEPSRLLEHAEYADDGSPLPKAPQFFRRAEDCFQHDSPAAKITDLNDYRSKLRAAPPKLQSYELSTKHHISAEYL